jgi:two-component system phosphate regulon sensor histidine kinase PhoR
MENHHEGYQTLLNERTVILVLGVLMAFFWAIDLINIVAVFFILAVLGALLIQLEIKRRVSSSKLRRQAVEKKRQDHNTGFRSVRANTLNGVTLPIIIIGDNLRIIFANTAATELLGDDIIDNDAFLYLRRSKFVEALDTIFEDGKKNAGVIRYTDKKERSFDVTLTRVPGTSKESVSTQAMAFFYEVTSLLQTEQMRVDFVANASHELRTPLSSLIGFIETLQGPAADDKPAQERFLGIMQTEAERMVRLIDDLLSLSKIEMSRHTQPDTKVDLKNLIQSALVTASAAGAARGVVFKTEIDERNHTVIADSDQIMQVMLNLTVNAAKYAIPDSEVTVTVKPGPAKKFLEVSIADQGPGIGQEHLARLTERFYRIDDARSRQMGGTGLGLAIVKHILLRHESPLDIKSNVGIGTVFSFRLKKA